MNSINTAETNPTVRYAFLAFQSAIAKMTSRCSICSQEDAFLLLGFPLHFPNLHTTVINPGTGREHKSVAVNVLRLALTLPISTSDPSSLPQSVDSIGINLNAQNINNVSPSLVTSINPVIPHFNSPNELVNEPPMTLYVP